MEQEGLACGTGGFLGPKSGVTEGSKQDRSVNSILTMLNERD